MSREDPLHTRLIISGEDSRWPQWKAIYDTSFDESERLSDEYYADLLAAKASDGGARESLIALESTNAPGTVIGIAQLSGYPEYRATLLLYFATRSDVRGHGVGRSFYAEMLGRSIAMGADLMLFEVEIPRVVAQRSADEAELASRRIAWYQRQGALVLSGIRYTLTLDTGIEPVEMHLIAHPFRLMTPEEVFAAARGVFGAAVEQTGDLSLE